MLRSLTSSVAIAALLAGSAFAQPHHDNDRRDSRNDHQEHSDNQQDNNQQDNRHDNRQDNNRQDNRRDDHHDNDHHDNNRHDDHSDNRRGNTNRTVVINQTRIVQPRAAIVNRPQRYYYPNRYPTVVYRDRYPAYGYYTSAYYSQRPIPIVTESPYVEVRCSNQPILGTIVGGTAGGLLGNQFGHGRGRTGATITGALLGAILGHSIDRANESCAYQALEYGAPDTQVTWVDPSQDYSYTVTPGPVSDEGDGRYCREYQAKILVGGQMQNGYGQACRQPDGSWEVVD